MRVIAGKYRSRPLRAPRGMHVRPTSDRLRETLFNVLTAGDPQRLEGSVWIDVFAGSGAVGIEALSRGARMVYFIEDAKASVAAIRGNLKSLGIEDGFEILQRDAAAALRQLDAQAVSADFVFVDPPYSEHEAYTDVLGLLSQSQMLQPEAIVIAEHDKRFDPGEVFGALRRYRTLTQGDAVLSCYAR